ncbi:MobC family plasmid mobilization relaxosome protein [Clostridium sp. MSJ-4]|uniref:MobC family plasmid mobilization relaxosome protein n=1 Tax=Clostridium simiarum TaxID=2841506 RepID=A0ABS6F669_9CLOT|nr:plasmid mobilization relaxosome protein MobC [Clostridium simiarum]MBU5593002.1 MobC family plasmid mobilization relaxosome protein [Clostridium simiarum]
MKQVKDRNYAFRITEKDLNTIKRKANRAKMSVTDYITESALEKKIIIIDALPEIVSQLKKIGNNLNQLTMLSHQGVINTVNLDETEESLTEIYWKINELTKVVDSDGGV